ncbi:hypothetical protein [Alkalicoccobacillus gibsonii]|uniref:hypothetical protein n=1 Tax=Alkalicoccobacillus gibsonii TaxID=79881 RepID=UPI003515494D
MIHWYMRKASQWVLMASFTLWAVQGFFHNDWFMMVVAIVIIIGTAFQWFTDNKKHYLECVGK